ncbi:YecH family metal-binding protein [Pelagicoccus sp. SDUM812003]|uniref:YecH family metal-binding protein n=1 Tax=Pelagicoccus sp. SDUM812003 TaxID=3041267 RepID=UPI00280C73E1|nr:YecH family metal-binding protein [Pelagicoccus sp. SDUM812003]MDQ8202348.1 YecH family protein [Pelagicoccus sp. SDUM812003]
MNTQNVDVHAHEILEMMLASGESYTNESLSAKILERFGAQARFHTCSGSGMDAYEIVDHLWMKGKFTGDPSGFQFLPGSRCDH